MKYNYFDVLMIWPNFKILGDGRRPGRKILVTQNKLFPMVWRKPFVIAEEFIGKDSVALVLGIIFSLVST
jgi:hypothetical protein